MTNIWNIRSGENIGTINERTPVDIRLPISFDQLPSDLTFTVISGSLPGGLYIKNQHIIGMAYEVARNTNFTFCIRASSSAGISDRTMVITIAGPDTPEFITLAGNQIRNLDIGPNHQLFVVSNTYVDYQLEAFDPDTAAGQKLSYFIPSKDGELPPGLSLTEDGRIYGIIKPVLTLKKSDGNGAFDTAQFDDTPYDFGIRSSNGYDSYYYESKSYDFSLPAARPQSLNRNYEFYVTVTDGDSYVRRKFAIYVVGDDYFRADSTSFINDTGFFTADVTYMSAPIWLTKSNLGEFRANNYVLVKLDTYDVSQVIYSIDNINHLPPGMKFDPITGDIFGKIPYQPAITKTYTFTITATRYGNKDETAESSRTFSMSVFGELDSVLSWVTDSNLGSLDANSPSVLKVSAVCSLPSSVLIYHITSGSLPPGLTLDVNGEIVGNIQQFKDVSKNINGILAFDTNDTTFDNNTTIFDRVFTFTVQVRDQYSINTNTKQFTLSVNTPDKIPYSNIKVMPLLKPAHRAMWKDFINDTTIFPPDSIYRTNDQTFGIQTNMEMTIYAGINTTDAAAYISAMGLNHKKKRFNFGSIKKALARETYTSDVIYEVIYIEMIDPYEPNGKKLAPSLSKLGKMSPPITVDESVDFWDMPLNQLDASQNRPHNIITVDSTGYKSSNSQPSTYYPNSISNWRKRIRAIGSTDRKFLPLWMRTIQSETKLELGFTLAIPLCFCKPGTADDILLNIKHSSFDFKQIDYTIDRYIIDAVDGYTNDKYLVFRNDRITI
jgi:hypothetical protein